MTAQIDDISKIFQCFNIKSYDHKLIQKYFGIGSNIDYTFNDIQNVDNYSSSKFYNSIIAMANDQPSRELLQTLQKSLSQILCDIENHNSYVKAVPHFRLGIAIIEKKLNLYTNKVSLESSFKLLKKFSDNPFILLYFLCDITLTKDQLNLNLEDLCHELKENFLNPLRSIRLLTFYILDEYEKITGRTSFFYRFLKVELILPDFFNYKYRELGLSNILYFLDTSPLSTHDTLQLYLNFAVSHYSQNLILIYKGIDDLLINVYKSPHKQNFILVWFNILCNGIDFLTRLYTSNLSEYQRENFEVGLLNNQEKNFDGDFKTIYRSVIKISHNFKDMFEKNESYVVDTFCSLACNFPFDCNLALHSIEFYMEINIESKLYIWKEIIILFLKFLKEIKIEKEIIKKIFNICLNLISVSIPDVSKAALSTYIKLSKHISNEPQPDLKFLCSLYNKSLIETKNLIFEYFKTQNSRIDHFSILIRVLLSIYFSKKSKENFKTIFKELLSQSLFDGDSYRITFISQILLRFELDLYDKPHLFCAPKILSKSITVLHTFFSSFNSKLKPFIDRLFNFVIYTGNSCLQIFSSSILSNYVKIYKNIYVQVVKFTADLMINSENFPSYFSQIENTFILPIISKSQNITDESNFLTLILAISRSSSFDQLLKCMRDSKPLIMFIVDCLGHAHSNSEIILSILINFVTNYLRLNCSFNSFPCNLDKETVILSRKTIPARAFIVDILHRMINYIQTEKSNLNFKVLLSQIKNISNCFIHINDEDLSNNFIKMIFELKSSKTLSNMKHDIDILSDCLSNILKSKKNIDHECIIKISNWLFSQSNEKKNYKEIIKAFFEAGYIKNDLFEILLKLISFKKLGNDPGPNVPIRLEAFRSLENYDFQNNLSHPSFLYFVFVISLKTFLSCSSEFVVCSVFYCLINKFFTSSKNSEITPKIKFKLYLVGRKLIGSSKELEFQSGVRFFSELVKMEESPEYSNLIEFHKTGFFENIIHIQSSVCVKALTRFRETLNDTAFSSKILTHYFLPIILHFINNKKATDNKSPEITNESILALSDLATKIQFSDYLSLIQKFTKIDNVIYDDGLKLQKLRLRTLISLLERFSFQILQDSEPSNRLVTEQKILKLVSKLSDKLFCTSICEKIKDILPPFTDVIEKVIKAPLTIAIVKLLKVCDDSHLKHHFRGIYFYLIQMLGDIHEDSRTAAQKLLPKIVLLAGPNWFTQIINEMNRYLSQGFQKHVFVFTLHNILLNLNESFDVQINQIIPLIIKSIISDKFGNMNEERQVPQLASKAKEVKFSKGYLLCQYIGQHAYKEKLYDFIMSFKKLNTTVAPLSSVKIVQNCLVWFMKGLILNPHHSPEILLIFSHVCIRDFINNKSVSLKTKTIPIINTRLLPPDPRKMAAQAETTLQIEPLIVAFGFNILYFLMRKKTINSKEIPSPEMLEPFVKYVLEGIENPYVEITTKSLNCLKLFLTYKHPSFETRVSELIYLVHKLINDLLKSSYSLIDITNSIKVLTLLVKKSVALEKEIASILILFCENVILNYKSPVCFPLLRLFIKKKVKSSYLKSIIKTLKYHSITSNVETIREESISFLVFFIKKRRKFPLKSFIRFYLDNLYYSQASGRISALKILTNMIQILPFERWSDYSMDIFARFSHVLGTDDDENIRNTSLSSLKTLLIKVDTSELKNIIDSTLIWFTDYKENLIDIGCCIFYTFVETKLFSIEENSNILPVVIRVLDRLSSQKSSETQDDPRCITMYKILNLLREIHSKTKFSTNPKFSDLTIFYFDTVLKCLESCHLWVIQVVCQIFSDYLIFTDMRKVADFVFGKCKKDSEISWTPSQSQLVDLFENAILAATSHIPPLNAHEKSVAFLVLLTEFISSTSIPETFVYNSPKIIFSKLLSLSNKEKSIISTRHRCILTLLKWIAGVVAFANYDSHKDLNHIVITLTQDLKNEMMRVVNRELHSTIKNSDIRTLASNVLDVMKKCMNTETFLNTVSESSINQNMVTKKRKSQIAILKAKDPQRFHQIKNRKKLSKAVKTRLKKSLFSKSR